MKKLIATLLTLVLLLSLCAPAMAEAAHAITSSVVPFDFSDGGISVDAKLYFLDGANDLPYIEANDWLELYNTLLNALNTNMLGLENGAVTYSMAAEGPIVTYTRHNKDLQAYDNGVTMVLDFDKDTINFIDYNLFMQKASSGTLLDMTALNYVNKSGEASVLQKVDRGTFDRYGDELVLPLRDYGIDLVEQDGLYLIPLQTLSDFIMTTVGYNFYFNGQRVFVDDNTTKFADDYYAAPTAERSEALVKYGYGELCMMLDYMYGMKDTHEITSFAKLFHEVGFDAFLKGSSVADADKAIYRLLTDYLDDNHTAWHAYSYLTGPIDYTAPMGMGDAQFNNQARTYMLARREFFPEGVPGYQEVGNTAYITFDQFQLGSVDPEYYYSVEDPMEFDDTDTIGLMIKAHAQITRENSPIENVVIDLSCNSGGMADTAVFVIAWFLGEASIGMKDAMTGAMCASTYRADINRDRQFDEKDTLVGKKLYCMISPMSFSCGNLVPCIFKESGKVTLLGRTSGGGSCVVLNVSSPWGTSFQISGPRRLSFMKNGSFYNVDRGADPDILISQPEKYYDRQALTDYINSIY